MFKRCKIIFVMISALAVLIGGSGTAFAGWTVTDLGALSEGEGSFATAINNNGQVVGYSTVNGWSQTRAFLWDGQMRDLGVIGGSSSSLNSIAYGINDNGQVVGTAQAVNGGANSYAFLHSGGSMQNLGVAGAAYGINNSGQIAGTNYSNSRAFLYNNGSVQDLGTYSGTRSNGRAINSSGQVAAYDGVGSGQSGTVQAFVWSNGTKQGLGTLGGTSSSAYSINNAGQVVGISDTTLNKYSHAFLYSNGIIDLGTLGDWSQANQINNYGQIVGTTDGVFDDGALTHAALWTINADGSITLTDLNDLVLGSGWSLQEATGINDKGQIVGYGLVGEGFDAQTHAFLLSQEAAPVPLPPALYMFGSALAGLGALRRRFRV